MKLEHRIEFVVTKPVQQDEQMIVEQWAAFYGVPVEEVNKSMFRRQVFEKGLASMRKELNEKESLYNGTTSAIS